MRHLLVLSLAWGTAAHAVTIDFEALQIAGSGFYRIDDVTGDPYVYEEDGFRLTETSFNYGFHRWGMSSQQYIDNGSTNLYNNTPDGITRIERIDGATFSMQSINLAELNGPDRSPVTFTGFKAGGATVTATFTLDGISFRPETFTLPSTFTGLQKVEWAQTSPYHTFDTIILNGGGGGPTINLGGSCPSSVAITASGFTPGGLIAIVRSNGTGSFAIPSGGCAGTLLGLSTSGIGLLTTVHASGSGGLTYSGSVGAALCTKYFQFVDLATCSVSNVDQF